MSTRPLLCRCKACHLIIWFAYDEGMPVYADTEPLTIWQEIAVKLGGRLTFNLVPGVGLWIRDIYGINRGGRVLAEHSHRAGFYEMGPRCPTPINEKATDSSVPPF